MLSALLLSLWMQGPHARSVPPVATEAGLYGVFHVLDCTAQGYVDEGEVSEHAGIMFRSLDKNRSRAIEREEMVAWAGEPLRAVSEAYFDRMDTNGDGGADHFEYTRHLIGLVEEADLDGDGDATWAELKALRDGGPRADER